MGLTASNSCCFTQQRRHLRPGSRGQVPMGFPSWLDLPLLHSKVIQTMRGCEESPHLTDPVTPWWGAPGLRVSHLILLHRAKPRGYIREAFRTLLKRSQPREDRHPGKAQTRGQGVHPPANYSWSLTPPFLFLIFTGLTPP